MGRSRATVAVLLVVAGCSRTTEIELSSDSGIELSSDGGNDSQPDASALWVWCGTAAEADSGVWGLSPGETLSKEHDASRQFEAVQTNGVWGDRSDAGISLHFYNNPVRAGCCILFVEGGVRVTVPSTEPGLVEFGNCDGGTLCATATLDGVEGKGFVKILPVISNVAVGGSIDVRFPHAGGDYRLRTAFEVPRCP